MKNASNIVKLSSFFLDTLPIRQSSSLYGEGMGELFLTDLNCNGGENNLFECDGSSITECDHSEDAGVRCGGKVFVVHVT